RTPADCHEMLKRALQPLDRGGIRALLRGEHPRGTVRAQDRTPDVTRHFDRASGQRWMHLGKVDPLEVLETGAAGTDLAPARVGEVSAERLQHARTAVGAGAPS